MVAVRSAQVSAGPNIIAASMSALVDGYEYHLAGEVPAPPGRRALSPRDGPARSPASARGERVWRHAVSLECGLASAGPVVTRAPPRPPVLNGHAASLPPY